MKSVVFTLDNGDQYGLPLEEVAKIRAAYYAAKDPDTTFQEEYEYVMNDSYAGIDWFLNNQDPEDFMGKYFLIKPGKPISLFDRIRDAAKCRIEDVKTALEGK